MNFSKIAITRQSCRKYNPNKTIEEEKLIAVLECARLSPSACNSQPYHITVCKGEKAREVAKATMDMGANKFAIDAPVMLVISEDEYNKSASVGAKAMKNDFRSIDIGIVAAFITASATSEGLSTCILGWLNNKKIQNICDINATVRLVICLGYAADSDKLRQKKRKDLNELIKVVE